MKEKEQEFSTAVWAKWFTDAIHKIRAQKQRPSVERICHAVRQHHPLADSLISAQLENLVSQGLILKVFNKGLSTYKDPSGDSARKISIGKDADLTKMVSKAVKELSDRENEGCTLKVLEKYLQHSNCLKLEAGVDLTSVVKSALKKGVDRGLILVDKKLYRSPLHSDHDKTPLSRKTPKVEPTPTTPDSSTPIKRRRRKSQTITSVSPKKEGLPICIECLGTAAKNKEGEAEELRSCSSCGSGVHASCLPGNQADIFTLLITRGNDWKCDECSSCSSCNVQDQTCNVVCGSCNRCFHIGCLVPSLDKKAKAAWICQACIDGQQPPTPPPKPEATPRARHNNLRIAHLKSLRKAARANLVRRRGKVKEGVESSSEDVTSINSLMNSDLPPGVTEKDLEVFKLARDKAAQLTKEEQTLPEGMISPKEKGLPPRCPAAIEFGQYLIKTWYSSPFPQEYARLGKLFLCEFCLKYAKSKVVLNRHLEKCTWRHPPGTEIYRHDDLSVFEVDGNVAKFYCQNLCLLAKLFLDHKTLYYDVEPFLFYVLTINDDKGFHVIGYFSKEKHCVQKYNVSCIMTLPQYQRKGYGRFLIDFSYLLSKEEGMAGTPEKPLSDLGRVSYHAYWRSVLLEYLDQHRDTDVSLGEISRSTGLHVEDISASLQEMRMMRVCNGSLALVVDWSVVDVHVAKVKASTCRIPIVPEFLRWTPLVPQLINPFKSQEEESNDASGEEEEEEVVERKVVEEKSEVKVGIGRRGRKKRGRAKQLNTKEPRSSVVQTPKDTTSAPLRQRTLTEMIKRGRKRRLMDREVSSSERGSVGRPKRLKREPEREGDSPVVRPSRLRLNSATTSSHDDDEDTSDKARVPLVTRTGRVSSLKVRSEDLPKPKEKQKSSEVINKRSIAAKLRWVERRKKQASIKLLKESSLRRTVKLPGRKLSKRLGRPPKARSEEEKVREKMEVASKVGRKKRGWVKGVARKKTKEHTKEPVKKVVVSSKENKEEKEAEREEVTKIEKAEEKKPVVEEEPEKEEEEEEEEEEMPTLKQVETVDIKEKSNEKIIEEKEEDKKKDFEEAEEEEEEEEAEKVSSSGIEERREIIKPVERRVLSDDSSDDSRPPRSDHSRSPSPRHSVSGDEEEEEDDQQLPPELPMESKLEQVNQPEHEEKKQDTPPPAPQEYDKPELVAEKIDPPIVVDEESSETVQVEESKEHKIEEVKTDEKKPDEIPEKEEKLEKLEEKVEEKKEDKVMEESRTTVDLTQDDSDSPPPPRLEREIPPRPEPTVTKKAEPVQKLIREVAGGSERKSPQVVEEPKKRMEEMRLEEGGMGGSGYETVHGMHYAPCEVDVSHLGLDTGMDAIAQERACYTDCAQQVVHHQHHMHGSMVHYQQAKSAAQPSRSKGPRSPQIRHQVASPQPQPPHYHQAPNYPPYIMHRGAPQGPSSNQRLASCSNFYLQGSTGQQAGSLAKLQQLTNGLETLPPHMAGSAVTPPPSHATPPPPPSYHKFYQTPSPSAPSSSRSRHPQPPQALIPQYNPSFNGYRPQQPTSPYITNPNFINPSQMQMMNVQPQYPQDPQQNSMYATYGYLNGSLMQPLNSTMRR